MKFRLLNFCFFFLMTSLLFEAFEIHVHASPLCFETIARLNSEFERIQELTPLGLRGFLSTQPALTAEARVAAMRRGINFLGVRFFVSPSEESAQTHDAMISDPGQKALYFISSLPVSSDLEAKRNLLSQGAIYFDGAEVIRVSGEQISMQIPADSLQLSDYGARLGIGYFATGWLYSPKHHAILRHQDLKGRSISYRLLKAGYRVTFNQKFDDVLEGMARQVRKNGASTKFTPEYQNVLRRLFEYGFAYSVEVWSPQGELVAGDVGFRYENLFKGDSVFFQDTDQAVLAAFALSERLMASGVHFVDSGSNITGYSAGIGTSYVDSETFQRLVAEVQALSVVDLRVDWTWDLQRSASESQITAAQDARPHILRLRHKERRRALFEERMRAM